MTKRIKILFTIPNFDTAGSGKVVYDLVKHIDKSVFDPHICCTHSKGEFFKTVENLNVPIHLFPFYSKYYPLWQLPSKLQGISRFFRKHKFHIIHSWHWSSDITEPLAAKFAGIPFVYTKKAMGWGNKAWQWRSQLSRAIITINSDMETQFFSKMPHKTVAIPIGLNVNDFGIIEKAYSNADGYFVDKNDFVIVSIANLVPVKGIEYLLEAVRAINDAKIKVIIVGDDTSSYALELKQNYASETILFTGKKQNIKDYLALADLFVIPTKNEGRKEGQPIAPIEAMLSGRVVLGSDVAGIRDVLKPFPELLFQPHSVDDLKEKITMLMQLNEKQRQELGEKLFQHAATKYSIEHSIKQHESLYKRLVI